MYLQQSMTRRAHFLIHSSDESSESSHIDMMYHQNLSKKIERHAQLIIRKRIRIIVYR